MIRLDGKYHKTYVRKALGNSILLREQINTQINQVLK